MCEYRPDINPFSVEMNDGDQPELIAAHIENNELADLVDGTKRLLELRKAFKVPAAAKRKPASKRSFGSRMLCPELNQGPLCDYSHGLISL